MATLEKPKTKVQEKRDEIAWAKQKLTEYCPPGTVIYTKCNHVSASGMSRSISLYVVDRKDCEILDISYWAAKVMDDRTDPKNHGIKVGGCGMDMGFHVVMNLSYTLHGSTAKVPDLPNGRQDIHAMNNPTSELYHAGYSLIQKWL
jgi:hypothetical protein